MIPGAGERYVRSPRRSSARFTEDELRAFERLLQRRRGILMGNVRRLEDEACRKGADAAGDLACEFGGRAMARVIENEDLGHAVARIQRDLRERNIPFMPLSLHSAAS